MKRWSIAIVVVSALALAANSALAQEETSPPEEPVAGEAPRDHREALRQSIDQVSQKRFLHGFRLGYLFVANHQDPINSNDPTSPSLAEKYGMRSPHQFLLGYEMMFRVIGHEWLNILLVTNASIAGMEQSKFFPSANGLIGFEFGEMMQLGVGVNATPQKEKPVHMILAAGWTPRVGDFYTPIHAFFVPDVDGQHRMGVTVGVNW
jgi:hypothetical protein